MQRLSALEWDRKVLRLLDQRRLPMESVWLECRTAADVAQAITDMVVRGAPAIAAAAAYGVAMEAQRQAHLDPDALRETLLDTIRTLERTRPTAVNLFWALERMRRRLETTPGNSAAVASALVEEAEAIAESDRQINRAIGDHGARLFSRPVRILTHCNTGSLATVEYGTALGIIRRLHEQGQLRHVWVDETRPYLQGARLTAFELAWEQIPHTLVTDSMAGHLMRQGAVDAVIVGADRIARNGDTANKIGTYTLAVLCQYHRIPFYVAAPTSTFDLRVSSGAEIPIEERNPNEVTEWFGIRIAPPDTRAAHPAFDVTPHELVTAIVTEHGVIETPNAARITEALARWGVDAAGTGRTAGTSDAAPRGKESSGI